MGRIIQGGDRHLPEPVYEFNRRSRMRNAVPVARQDILVNPRVQVRESVRELHLRAIDGHRSESRLLPGLRDEREVSGIDRKEPANVGSLESKETTGTSGLPKVDSGVFNGPE